MKADLPYDALPTWFQEGLATHVADEPRCTDASMVSQLDLTQLATKGLWQAFIRQHGALTAARHGTRWVRGQPGSEHNRNWGAPCGGCPQT